MLLDGSDRVDGPVAFDLGQFKPLAELLQIDSGHIPLVGYDQDNGFLHVGVRDDAVELLGGQLDALAVRAVDHVD
jgi:hypothetical protein